MNVKDIIEGMADRAFRFSFLQGINDLYDSRDYGDTEPDYQKGFNHLMSLLTDKQKEDLNRMENAYTERRYFAAEYGFKCGLYGAFRQFFGCSGVQDGGFEDLVADDLLMQPKMQRHRSNYANIELCNKIDTEIMELVHDPQSLHSLFYTQDALKTNNTARPHSCGYGVDMTAVDGITLSKGCTGGKLGPVTHKALSARQVHSGQFNPFVLAQTFHTLTSFQKKQQQGIPYCC